MSKLTAALGRELRELIPAMIFFLIAFHMLSFTKAVLLDDYRVTAVSATSATVSAIIVAKTILILNHTAVARLFSGRMVSNLLWKTVLFGSVAILLWQLEEILPALWRHGDVGEVIRHQVARFSSPRFLVLHMWLYTMLLIYSLASEAVGQLGRDRLLAILLGPVQTRHDGRAAPRAP